MTKLRPLTEKQHDAVRAYALTHGRTWKASLRDDWMNARTTGILQALRNSHGPTWLASYSLKQARPSMEPLRFVSVTGGDGDVYEATRMGTDDPWTVTYPEGQDRFHGTEREVRAHIRQLMVHGSAAKLVP